MTWKLSHEALVETLELERSLRQSTLFRSTAGTKALIESLASRHEPGTIPAIAGALFSKPLHSTAATAVHQLLSDVTSLELIHLGDILTWPYGCTLEAWTKLQPQAVDNLSGTQPNRTSILGLLAFHRNGYVRHEAVRLLARIHDGSELRFLLIRQNDWVDEICSDVQGFVQERLTESYAQHFAREAPLVVHLLDYTRRDLGDVVQSFTQLLIQPQQAGLLEQVLNNDDRACRRCLTDLALQITGSHQERVVRLGIQSPDPVLRMHCTKFISQTLASDEALQACSRLLQDKFMPVRREAYWLKVSLFPEMADEIWRECLFDNSRSLRELARFYLRDTATDVVEIYREGYAIDPNSQPSLSGIADTGDATDLPTLRQALTSPRAGIRAEGIRGIGRIGSVEDVLSLTQFLTDESPRVVREASRQIEPHSSQLGSEFLMGLLTPDISECAGRSILRLIFDLGRWQGLSFLIRTATFENPAIASYAESLIEMWFTPPRSYRIFTQPTDHQRHQIHDALANSSADLRPQFLSDLASWLKTYDLAIPT